MEQTRRKIINNPLMVKARRIEDEPCLGNYKFIFTCHRAYRELIALHSFKNHKFEVRCKVELSGK